MTRCGEQFCGLLLDARYIRLDQYLSVEACTATIRLPIAVSMHLASGTFGICKKHVGASPVDSNLAGPLVVSNAGVTITAGVAQGEAVFDPASVVFGQRIVNLGWKTIGFAPSHAALMLVGQ